MGVYAYFLVIIPILSLLLYPFLSGRTFARVSTGLTALSFLISLVLFIFIKPGPGEWFLLLDGLGKLLSSYILLVSLIVHKYSVNYMKDEKFYKGFFVLLDLMTANLVLLVLSDNLYVFLTAWHLMGLLLYFMLAVNSRRHEAIRYAQVAYFTHLLADVPLLIAFIILHKSYKTLSISELASLVPSTQMDGLWLVSLLLMVSALIKSAQMPFHYWLVYSMEGPTPVSALMHAGIVNAGAFLINRFAFLYPYDKYGLILSFLVGIITAIVGSTLMLLQNDVKRALGYSTVGQMGYMMVEIGVGAFSLAVYHMIAHGIFKATLFLSSGGVIHEARRSPNAPRDQIYDALVEERRVLRDLPTFIYALATFFVPILLVVAAHVFFEEDILKHKSAIVLLFFGWATSVQVFLNLFKLHKEKPWTTLLYGVLSLFVLLSLYTFFGSMLQSLLYPDASLINQIYERSLGQSIFLVVIFLTLITILAGWLLILYSGRNEKLKLSTALYAHLSRELYIPDLYRLAEDATKRWLTLLAKYTIAPVSLYGIFYLGSQNFDTSYVSFLLVPLFPLSIIWVHIANRYWLYAYVPMLFIAFAASRLLELPHSDWITLLASFTFLFHSLRLLVLNTLRAITSELLPVSLSLLWLMGDQPLVLTAPLLLYLLSLYILRYYGTTHLGYLRGFAEKSPNLSVLTVILLVYVFISPPSPIFHFLFQSWINMNNLLYLLALIPGWFSMGVAMVRIISSLLYGKPREDIMYVDILRR